MREKDIKMSSQLFHNHIQQSEKSFIGILFVFKLINLSINNILIKQYFKINVLVFLIIYEQIDIFDKFNFNNFDK